MATLQPRTTARIEGDARLVLAALAVASGIELAILRLFTRTEINIPELEKMQSYYALIIVFVIFAYFVGFSLLFC